MPQAARHELDLVVAVDNQDLRVFRVLGRGRVNVQLTEAAAEGLVLLERQLLIAKEEDQVPQPGVPQRRQGRVVERLRQVDAGNLGADDRRERCDLQTDGRRGR